MGILKNREELLPVTCAVLKDSDREAFFDQLKRKAGRLERVAQACGVTTSSVSDWMNGKLLIPYHFLQRMAREFEIEAPEVTELRREFQAVSQPLAPSRPAPARDDNPRAAPRASAPKAASPRREPKLRREKPKAEGRTRRKQAKPAKAKAAPAAPAPKKDGKGPKLSEALSYWLGAFFCAGRYDDGRASLSADRRIGQNFAALWARMTEDLFGFKPELAMKDDNRLQEASFEPASAGEFFARLELKPGSLPKDAPPAPRWAWSNPKWKTAFLSGVVDVSCRFHRTPTLNIDIPSDALRQSVLKMLASLSIPASAKPEGTVVVEGREPVEKYFESAGTRNLKLRDQYAASQGRGRGRRAGPSGPAAAEGPGDEAATEASETPAE